MTGEGREYGPRKREDGDEDEEIDRMVREMRREVENEESPEPEEHREHEYDPEKCVREAIREIQQEEAERLKLEEQKESKEEPQESKEKIEISDEWDVDECVREIIEEVQQEEAELQKLREEREHAEMEKEEQLESSCEARKETADRDEFVELEERILEGFEEYGIDPEEVKEHWRKKFEEEVQDELGEKSRIQTEGEDDEAVGHEKSAESHHYYDDGSGLVYEIQIDSKETSVSETESCNEMQEVQEEPPSEQYETSESKKISGENELENVTPIQETKDVVGERSRKGEGPEQEESTRINSEEVKHANEKTTKESADEYSEEPAPEEKEEKSISTPETDTKRTDEHMESEGSQDTEENIEEDSESREEEIWNNYEREHESLEDEAYKRYLREVLNRFPEEERERFREFVREQVQTIEEFEELARRHGLDELLEDDEVIEEVRKYLKLRQALEDNPDSVVEQLAEEMGIDIDLARDWSRGESEPYSLKKLLNLEAFYLWDEVIRSYREQNQPRSREELVNIVESNTELRVDRFYQLELDDAISFVEIMAMRRRGEIERRIRNGREVYSRKQITELSVKYTISTQEIISWLRGERTPPLIERIRKLAKKEAQSECTSTQETHSRKHLKRGEIDPLEVYQLYFVDDLTLEETAKEFGLKTIRPIRRILDENGWATKPQDKIDFAELHRMNIEEGLSLGEIARIAGVTPTTVRKAFKQKGWKVKRYIRKRETPDIEKVYSLYYELGLAKEEIGEELNASENAVRDIFREMGWPSKVRKFASKKERSKAKKESRKEIKQKTVELREKLFGTKCRICGISKEEKTLIIHRKDGQDHDHDLLWRVRFLRTVNPEEYVALCPSCHPGTHWMMDTFNLQWEDVKNISESKFSKVSELDKSPYHLDENALPSEKYLQIKQNRLDNDTDLRRLLFGEVCMLCGVHHNDKTLVVHRKDGRSHDQNLIRGEEKLSRLNPDDWVSLCQKCHREVHWAMDTLFMEWKKLEDLKKRQ